MGGGGGNNLSVIDRLKLIMRNLGRRDGGDKKAHGRMKQKGGSVLKRGKVKAVMFVPYTHGSKLAKELREVEETMEGLTGYRMKIVERGGRKLSDMQVQPMGGEGVCTTQLPAL